MGYLSIIGIIGLAMVILGFIIRKVFSKREEGINKHHSKSYYEKDRYDLWDEDNDLDDMEEDMNNSGFDDDD